MYFMLLESVCVYYYAFWTFWGHFIFFVSFVFCKVLGSHWSFTLKMDSYGYGSFVGPN